LLRINPQSNNTSPSVRPLRTFQNIDRALPQPIKQIDYNKGLFSPGSESYGKASITSGSTNKNNIPRHSVQNKVTEVKSTYNKPQQQQRSLSPGSTNRGRSRSPITTMTSTRSPSSHFKEPIQSKSPNSYQLARSKSPLNIRSVSNDRGQKKTLFDKLYEVNNFLLLLKSIIYYKAHWEIEKGKELLKEKYNPSNQSFIPVVNKSLDSNKENIETSAANNNKDNFFKRLHDYHNKISEKREMARKNSDREMKSRIFHNKVLTVDEKKDMADRF
jgi:hypothetical protein